jgi:hypothetical protein
MITGATNFFTEKWVKLYKKEPDIEELNKHIQSKAVRVQPHIMYWDERKSETVKILAAYWLIELNVVVKADLESRSLVTFYSKDDLQPKE